MDLGVREFWVITCWDEVEFREVYKCSFGWYDLEDGYYYNASVFETELDAYESLTQSLRSRLCTAEAKMEALKEKV